MGCEAAKRSLVAALVVLGAVCFIFWGGRLNRPVSAQAQPLGSGNDGILVIPIQIARDSHGLAMVDTVAETLWIYEINLRGPAHKRLTLLAARSWRHDRKLERYNTGEPTPEQVKSLLDNAGRLPQQPDASKGILEMAEPDERAFDFGRQSK
jgi:hypothetical protein